MARQRGPTSPDCIQRKIQPNNTPVRKAVFPVAGLGTRFLPATKASPKEMLPVVDKPLIQYAVEEAYAAGIRHMIFVTGRSKRAIEDHFDTAYELEAELETAGKEALLALVRSVQPDDMDCAFVRQPRSLGLGHAVLCAEPLVGNEPFAVLLADDLMVGPQGGQPVLAQMVTAFRQQGRSVIAVQEVPEDQVHKYGIVAGEPAGGQLMRIERIVEKPKADVAPSRMGVAGRYILTPGVFEEIRNQPRGVGGEIQLTDGIARLMAHEAVYAFQYEGKRYDCGSKEGFLEATVELALQHPQVGATFRTYLKGLSSEAERTPYAHDQRPRRAIQLALTGDGLPGAQRTVRNCRPDRAPHPPLAAAQNVDELFTHGLLFHQLIARLLGKRLEVAHRPHIGGQYLQELAAGHFGQGLLGLENGQRTVQAPGVDFFVCFHGHQSLLGRPSPRRRSAFSSSVKNTGSCPRVRSQSANA